MKYEVKLLTKIKTNTEDWYYFALKNENSYMIGDGSTIIVFENGEQISEDKIDDYDDTVYCQLADCYFIAQEYTIYKKEINSTPPYPFLHLSSPCHTNSDNVLLSCNATNKLLVLQEGLKISVIDPENARKTLTVEFNKIKKALDFLLVGDSHDSFAVLGKRGHILLFDSHFEKTENGRSYYKSIKIKGPCSQKKLIISACPRGQYLVVVTRQRSRKTRELEHILRTVEITDKGMKNLPDVKETLPDPDATPSQVENPEYLVIPETSLTCFGYKDNQLLCLSISEARVDYHEGRWEVRVLRFDGEAKEWDSVWGFDYLSHLFEPFQKFGDHLYSLSNNGRVTRLTLNFSPL